jgi:hypothetical protein
MEIQQYPTTKWIIIVSNKNIVNIYNINNGQYYAYSQWSLTISSHCRVCCRLYCRKALRISKIIQYVSYDDIW